MKNIVVYTDKNESKLADVLAQIEDTNVRIENAENLKELRKIIQNQKELRRVFDQIYVETLNNL